MLSATSATPAAAHHLSLAQIEEVSAALSRRSLALSSSSSSSSATAVASRGRRAGEATKHCSAIVDLDGGNDDDDDDGDNVAAEAHGLVFGARGAASFDRSSRTHVDKLAKASPRGVLSRGGGAGRQHQLHHQQQEQRQPAMQPLILLVVTVVAAAALASSALAAHWAKPSGASASDARKTAAAPLFLFAQGQDASSALLRETALLEASEAVTAAGLPASYVSGEAFGASSAHADVSSESSVVDDSALVAPIVYVSASALNASDVNANTSAPAAAAAPPAAAWAVLVSAAVNAEAARRVEATESVPVPAARNTLGSSGTTLGGKVQALRGEVVQDVAARTVT